MSAVSRSIRGVVIMRIREKKGASRLFSSICVLLIIGIFVFAQQVSSESIFDSKRHFSLHEAKLDPPDFSAGAAHGNVPMYADTLEMYDIELEEEEERNIYKEVAVYVIVAAAVGYMIFKLIEPEKEETVPDDGKEPPIAMPVSVSVPFNRSP